MKTGLETEVKAALFFNSDKSVSYKIVNVSNFVRAISATEELGLYIDNKRNISWKIYLTGKVLPSKCSWNYFPGIECSEFHLNVLGITLNTKERFLGDYTTSVVNSKLLVTKLHRELRSNAAAAEGVNLGLLRSKFY